MIAGVPNDDLRQFAPRLGWAWVPDKHGRTVLRGGFGLYDADLAQNGWVTAFQAVHSAPGLCLDPVQNPGAPENVGCVPKSSAGGTANLIDSGYRTPYALHASTGVQRALGEHWLLSADFIHERDNHAYRAYQYTGGVNLFTPLLPATDPEQAALGPDLNVFHSDNRPSYNALSVHVQANVAHRVSLIANCTYAKAQT